MGVKYKKKQIMCVGGVKVNLKKCPHFDFFKCFPHMQCFNDSFMLLKEKEVYTYKDDRSLPCYDPGPSSYTFLPLSSKIYGYFSTSLLGNVKK